MSIKIFAYDNNTGKDIPSKIDVYPVELLLGNSISEIHSSISACQMFCIFTAVDGVDFVVRTEDERRILQAAVKFAKLPYNVEVRENSIWYSEKADINIIISNSVRMRARDMSTLLSIFLSEMKTFKQGVDAKKRKEVYIVCNMRSGTEILRTPNMDEAVSTCDQNPCCVVLNREEKVVYKSKYGKVAIPYNSRTHTARYKATHFKQNDGIFSIKQK